MRYLLLIILSQLSLSLTAQNWVEDFESGDLNSWKQLVGIADLVNEPKVEGNTSLRLWNFVEAVNSEAIMIHKTFNQDFGIYSYYARADGFASDADFYFQYQDDRNYYHVSHKPTATDNEEFVVAKVIDGVYTELYRQEAVEIRGKWVYISIERTCAGRMYVSYNNNNVLDINETDILLSGTIGLRTWSSFSYFDRIEFEEFDSEVYQVDAKICTGQEFKVGPKKYSMPGSYRDTLRTNAGCDSIVQLDLAILDSIIVDIDTVFCSGGSIMFDNELIDIPGMYTMDFVTPTGCDSIVNLFVSESPNFSLGPDRSVCDNNQLLISAQSQQSYLWNTGETTESLLVQEEGTYSIEIVDYNNCIQRDTINIRNQCELKMFSPNIFSPNQDAIHDTWKPEFDLLPIDYTLSIYDKWGNIVFESSDPAQSWDGQFKNKDVMAGIYIFQVVADSQKFNGDILIVR